jgi:hypothetical protein
MCYPQRLTTLWASTAWCRDNFTYFTLLQLAQHPANVRYIYLSSTYLHSPGAVRYFPQLSSLGRGHVLQRPQEEAGSFPNAIGRFTLELS